MINIDFEVIEEKIKAEYKRQGLLYREATRERGGTWEIYLDGIEQILQGLSAEEKQKLNNEIMVKLLLESLLIGDKLDEIKKRLSEECKKREVPFTNEDWQICRGAMDYWIKKSSRSIEEIQKMEIKFWVEYSLRYLLINNKLKIIKKKLREEYSERNLPFSDRLWQKCLNEIERMSAEEIESFNNKAMVQHLLKYLSTNTRE